MKPINVRQARSTFATILNAGEPTLVGDLLHDRAMIVPIDRGPRYAHHDHQRALHKAQAAANRAFRQLRKTLERRPA